MKKILIVLSVLAFFIDSYAYSGCKDKPIVIGVIDTGFGYMDHGYQAKLCRTGHKDFSSDKKFTMPGTTSTIVPLDVHGHGTNIVGIIESYVRPAHINYCILIIKYWTQYPHGNENLQSTVEAFRYATVQRIPYINYSSGGNSASREERNAVLAYLDHGGTLITAAGNERYSLDDPMYGYYPAKYDRRIIVVGSLNRKGVKSWTSNYGSIVNRWEVGVDVEGYGITMSGTSQATAAATGKIVSQEGNRCFK